MSNEGKATSVSDLERAEHLNTGNGVGIKRVSNFESNGSSYITPTSKQVATKITAPDANTTYVAIAPIGSAQASAVWQVQKIVTSGNDTTITWAGSGTFNQVATDLTSLIFA